MTHEEKLKKVCSDFSLLNEEQQDYVFGILQALLFAKSASEKPETAVNTGKSLTSHSS
ncbi:MAG: hypothetical protein LBG91_05250 [Treponema sp.]|jgi:hypothetical protein|nr:hypothetical protein [Treponema sp.]